MRSPHRPRQALPAQPQPSRDAWGRPQPGWLPASSESQQPKDWFAQADTAKVAAAAVMWAENGWRDDQLAGWLAGELASRRGGLTSAAWWSLAGAARLAAEVEPDRRAVAWASAAALLAQALPGFQGATAAGDPPSVALAQAVASGNAAAAGAAADQLAAQQGNAEALAELLRLACLFPGDAGCNAISAAALAQLAPGLAAADLRELLPAFAVALAEGPVLSPWVLAHRQRMAALAERLTALADRRDPEKARAFAEAKFRAHLLDAGAEGALKALLRAAEVGIPHELLAGSLVMAAAERVLRADLRQAADPDSLEGPAETAGLLLLASATRQLQGQVPARDWLELALFTASWVAGLATFDLPEAGRQPLPEPAALHQTWDHGPEIAKVIKHLQEGAPEPAIAVLRAYFLLALPEQPLSVQMRQVAVALPGFSGLGRCLAAALLHAGIDEFLALAELPQRERILAAAVRAALAVPAPADPLLLAELALRRLQLGGQPQSRIGAGPRP